MALSHAAAIVSRLYIFCVCFFLAIAQQGKNFWHFFPNNLKGAEAEKINRQVSRTKKCTLCGKLYRYSIFVKFGSLKPSDLTI